MPKGVLQMNRREKKDLVYIGLSGAMILLILFGVMVLDRGVNLHRSHAMQTQNQAPLSTEQFWQQFPG